MIPALRGMIGRPLAVAAMAACPSLAEARTDTLSCMFADGHIGVTFTIDHDQFAPALSPDDPPRRKITRVRLGSQSFVAEPFLMSGGVRGFWTDDPVTGTHVLTAQTDGSARYTGPGGGVDGICEDIG